MAILLGIDADRPRMKAALADGRRDDVQSYFFAGIRAVALVLVCFVVILMLDQTRAPAEWVELPIVAGGLLVALRTARIIWILNTVVTIAGKDNNEDGSARMAHDRLHPRFMQGYYTMDIASAGRAGSPFQPPTACDVRLAAA